MCGIAGMWYGSGKPAGRERLERMAAALRNRGPDGEGFLVQGELGLAHRRLKIVDLSDQAAQPMATPHGVVSSASAS